MRTFAHWDVGDDSAAHGKGSEEAAWALCRSAEEDGQESWPPSLSALSLPDSAPGAARSLTGVKALWLHGFTFSWNHVSLFHVHL